MEGFGIAIAAPFVIVIGVIAVLLSVIILAFIDPLTGGKISRWYEERLFLRSNA
jgi:hypothetical protein